MLTWLLSILLAIPKLIINIIFIIPMLIYKVLINHKADIIVWRSKKK